MCPSCLEFYFLDKFLTSILVFVSTLPFPLVKYQLVKYPLVNSLPDFDPLSHLFFCVSSFFGPHPGKYLCSVFAANHNIFKLEAAFKFT